MDTEDGLEILGMEFVKEFGDFKREEHDYEDFDSIVGDSSLENLWMEKNLTSEHLWHLASLVEEE